MFWLGGWPNSLVGLLCSRLEWLKGCTFRSFGTYPPILFGVQDVEVAQVVHVKSYYRYSLDEFQQHTRCSTNKSPAGKNPPKFCWLFFPSKFSDGFSTKNRRVQWVFPTTSAIKLMFHPWTPQHFWVELGACREFRVDSHWFWEMEP